MSKHINDKYAFYKSNQTPLMKQEEIEAYLVEYLSNVCQKYGYRLAELKILKNE